MNILLTGSDGFIGKNLKFKLLENKHSVIEFTRGMSFKENSLNQKNIDCVFHLAGENRPKNLKDFTKNNVDLTSELSDFLKSKNKKIPVFFSSSIQVAETNPYAESKIKAEEILKKLHQENGNQIFIYRLPNVFGKWSKPNYNSAVATFCHNISRSLDIDVHDPRKPLSLLYIDDLIDIFLRDLEKDSKGIKVIEIENFFETTVGELSETILSFSKYHLIRPIAEVGEGLERALYATYLSFLPKEKIAFKLPINKDERGLFVEVLKTRKSGQFSFLTARPGYTRGQHYHHTKNEQFLVISGEAEFNFKNLISNESFTISSSGDEPKVVQTIPGWIHNIKNVGKNDLIVMLWANELFDPENPDTTPAEI